MKDTLAKIWGQLKDAGVLRSLFICYEVCIVLALIGVIVILIHNKDLTWKTATFVALTVERAGRLIVKAAPVWWPIVQGLMEKKEAAK